MSLCRGVIGAEAGFLPAIDLREHRPELLFDDVMAFATKNEMLGGLL